MAPKPAKPTILFVHGAWHSPVHFAPIIAQLKLQGYPSVCPYCPSSDAKAPMPTMYDDAALIWSELCKLVEGEGKDVIVVLHSYGGVVGTEAVDASLAKQARQEKGLPGGVLQLLYMSAFLLPIGSSLLSAFGGAFPPFVPIEADGSCNMMESARRCYNDLPPAEQAHWVSELRPHSSVALSTPLTYAAWEHIPVTFLLCEKDEAIPFEVQKMMVDACPMEVKTETCTAGHSPFLSQIGVVVGCITRIANAERGNIVNKVQCRYY